MLCGLVALFAYCCGFVCCCFSGVEFGLWVLVWGAIIASDFGFSWRDLLCSLLLNMGFAGLLGLIVAILVVW